MQAVILAGGLGTRLHPFTKVIPKPLLPLGEKSILEVQIERLEEYGCEKVYLATNYKSNYLKGFFEETNFDGIDVEISKEEKPLGTVGPLSLLKEKLDEPFIVMNGDVLSLANFRKFYETATNIDSDLCVGVKKVVKPFSFGNVLFEGRFVTEVEEKPEIEKYILSGIYVMKPSILDKIPNNERMDIDQLIKKKLENNEKVSKYEIEEYWLDVGRVDSYEEAQEAYNDHFS